MRWSALRILRRMGASAFAQHITTLSSLEGFFGTMKSESYYPEKWSRLKADDLIGEIDAYIEWHNERRIESSLGYMSPMEYRKSLGYEP